MILMSLGFYNQPAGAFLPSILVNRKEFVGNKKDHEFVCC